MNEPGNQNDIDGIKIIFESNTYYKGNLSDNGFEIQFKNNTDTVVWLVRWDKPKKLLEIYDGNDIQIVSATVPELNEINLINMCYSHSTITPFGRQALVETIAPSEYTAPNAPIENIGPNRNFVSVVTNPSVDASSYRLGILEGLLILTISFVLFFLVGIFATMYGIDYNQITITYTILSIVLYISTWIKKHRYANAIILSIMVNIVFFLIQINQN